MVFETRKGDAGDLRAGKRRSTERGFDFKPADFLDERVAAVSGLYARPILKKDAEFRLQGLFPDKDQGIDRARLLARLEEQALGFGKLLKLAGKGGLGCDLRQIAAHAFRDFREIMLARWRHDDRARLGGLRLHGGKARFPASELAGVEKLEAAFVKGGDAFVVEFRGDRAVDGHLVRCRREGLVAALHLFANVAKRIHGAFAIEFVDDDDIREVEHIDLLELACRPEFRRHHV